MSVSCSSYTRLLEGLTQSPVNTHTVPFTATIMARRPLRSFPLEGHTTLI